MTRKKVSNCFWRPRKGTIMRTKIRNGYLIQLNPKSKFFELLWTTNYHLLPLTIATQLVGIHVPPIMTFLCDSSTKSLLGCKGLVSSLKVFKEILQYSSDLLFCLVRLISQLDAAKAIILSSIYFSFIVIVLLYSKSKNWISSITLYS